MSREDHDDCEDEDDRELEDGKPGNSFNDTFVCRVNLRLQRVVLDVLLARALMELLLFCERVVVRCGDSVEREQECEPSRDIGVVVYEIETAIEFDMKHCGGIVGVLHSWFSFLPLVAPSLIVRRKCKEFPTTTNTRFESVAFHT